MPRNRSEIALESIFTTQTMKSPYFSKTGRIRGVILRMIRRVAARRKSFKASELGFPTAEQNCYQLVLNGELKKLRQGKKGGPESIYSKTNGLRLDTLTNKHFPKITEEDVP